MLINIIGAKCRGIEALAVRVEVDICSGIGIHLVGLADTAVKESLLRTVTALQALGFHVPGKKIVINLAPADMHKRGGGYDLPIALGIVAASGQVQMPLIGDYLIMGELGLDGSVRDIEGALSFAELARREGLRGCILPLKSALEATEVAGLPVYGVRSLGDAVRIVSGEDCDGMLARNSPEFRDFQESDAGAGQPRADTVPYMDFSEIIGQESAKRGMEIAAAGGHNVILMGAPGAGKSSLAGALAGILPPMSREEALLTTKIYSVAGKGVGRVGLLRTRPVRSPHYSISLPALIGGGSGENILPGEVSLAHGGVLFLDEFNQMPKSVIESLRGPLEDRRVTISRLKARIEYPASFMLVAASNPCPCGYWGEGERCTCTPSQRMSYISRLSGPILDRIDIQLFLHPVDASKLVNRPKSETSFEVAARVAAARQLQRRRLEGTGKYLNAEMSSRELEIYCPLSEKCKALLEKIISSAGLSARAYTRIVKLARTIADLQNVPDILPGHIAEAASYRFLDRRLDTMRF